MDPEIIVPDTIAPLFWGYTAIWGLLSVYILWLGNRLSRAEKIVNELQDSDSGT